MIRVIKKYKNRRLYDTELSHYITLEQVQGYVVGGIVFRVEDSESGADLTNQILLQIIVEMEAGATPFLSQDILRQIIQLAHHPMSRSLREAMEALFAALQTNVQNNPYQKVAETWSKQIQQWQNLFKS